MTVWHFRVMGRDPFKERMENAKQIGVVFGQKTQLWWDIPVIETFRLLKNIYEIPDSVYQENMNSSKKLKIIKKGKGEPEKNKSVLRDLFFSGSPFK